MRGVRPLSSRTHPLTPRVVFWFRFGFLTAAGLIASVGVFFCVAGTVNWVRAVRSTDWPSADGTIVAREAQQSVGSSGLEYAYAVDGRALHGTRVTFLVRGAGQSLARETSAKYPSGAAVKVFYDPADPELAILEPGWDWSNVIPVAVGLFSVGFCALFAHFTLLITGRMKKAVSGAPK